MTREYMAFKAGRAFRRAGTNFVDPSPTKGAIWLKREEDDLVHFQWKSREADAYEEVRASCMLLDDRSQPS